MKELFKLFLVFTRVSFFTFGGYSIPMMERELCANLKWVEESELMDYYAVGQCIPGVIMINVATFIGYKRKGISGAVAASLGIIFPSLVVITIVAALFQNFSSLSVVRHAFAGIRVVLCAMLVDMIIRFFKLGIVDLFAMILFALALAASLFSLLSPSALVIAAGLSGVLFKIYRRPKSLKLVSDLPDFGRVSPASQRAAAHAQFMTIPFHGHFVSQVQRKEWS